MVGNFKCHKKYVWQQLFKRDKSFKMIMEVNWVMLDVTLKPESYLESSTQRYIQKRIYYWNYELWKAFCQYIRLCFCFWWRFWSIFPSRFLTLEKHQTLSQWRSLTIWSPYLLWIATVTHKTHEKSIENLLKYWEKSIKWALYTNSFLLSITVVLVHCKSAKFL